jgi:hypothetical protein
VEKRKNAGKRHTKAMTPSRTQRISEMFGSRKGGAILFALLFATIGTALILLSHAGPYTPPKLTLIINGVRIDGNPDPSNQEEQYINTLGTDHTIVTFRTIDPNPSPSTNFLLNRWMTQKPEKFYFTVGASDFRSDLWAKQPLVTPYNESALRNILSNPNCEGLYLHEIVSYYAQNAHNSGGKYDWWGVLKDPNYQTDLGTINLYVKLAKEYGKKVIWSEPSYGWSYMNSAQNPNNSNDVYYNPAYNYMGAWGNTVVPMFADNFGWRAEKTAAMIGALWDGRIHSSNVFGQSVQGWQFTDDNNRKDLLYGVKVPSTKTIPTTFSFTSPESYNGTQNASMCANTSNTLRDTTRPLGADGKYPYYPLPGVLADSSTIATCTYNSMNYGFSNTASVFQIEGPSDYMDMYHRSPFMQGVLNFINDQPSNTAKIILPIAGTCDRNSSGYVGCSTPAVVTANGTGITTKSSYTGQTISTTTWPNNSFTDPIPTASSLTAGPHAPAGWTAWNPLGNNTGTAPAAVSWGPGRIDLFTAGGDNAVWHKWYDNSAWSPGTTPYWEQQYGANTVQGQAVSSWGAGRLDVFEVRTSAANTVYQKTFSGGWGSWQPIITLPGSVTIVGKPAAVSWGSGRIDLFVRGSDNALWHTSYQGGSWSSWGSLGGAITSAPSVASWGSGHLDVFARGYDNAIWHKYFLNGWSGWSSIGNAGAGYTPSTAPAAVASGYGHIFVFYSDVNYHLYYKSFDASTGWPAGNAGWTYMGGTTAYAPAVSSWAQGRLDVFITGTDSRVYNTSIQMNLATYTPPPDSDNDGVPDSSDRCPNQYGLVSAGCPDSDGDGAIDPDDGCPTQWGPSANNHCPTHDIPLWHYYNPVNYDNFYTTTRNDGGFAYYGYYFKDCPVRVWDGNNGGMSPLWRYWNPTGGDHFYTIDRNDAGYAAYGYSFEGNEGWVYPPNSSQYLYNLERYFAGGWIVDHIYIRGSVGHTPGWSYPNYSFERVEAQVLGGC